MDKFPFAYKVMCYDYDEEKYYEANGFGICESYADAAAILEKRYGGDLITIRHLILYEEDSVIETTPEMRAEWEKEENEYIYRRKTVTKEEVEVI